MKNYTDFLRQIHFFKGIDHNRKAWYIVKVDINKIELFEKDT